jgi:hypothetical protein
MKIKNMSKFKVKFENNLILKKDNSDQDKNQKQTQEIFSEKWSKFEKAKHNF